MCIQSCSKVCVNLWTKDYVHDFFFFFFSPLPNRQTKAWTYGAHTQSGKHSDRQLFFTVCYFVLLKKSAPIFCLARLKLRQMSCFPSGVCIHRDIHVHFTVLYIYTCALWVRQCLTMHVNGNMHMHTLLNLAAVCGCLLLLDDLSVGESSLLLEGSIFFFENQRLRAGSTSSFCSFVLRVIFFFFFGSSLLSYVYLKYFLLNLHKTCGAVEHNKPENY